MVTPQTPAASSKQTKFLVRCASLGREHLVGPPRWLRPLQRLRCRFPIGNSPPAHLLGILWLWQHSVAVLPWLASLRHQRSKPALASQVDRQGLTIHSSRHRFAARLNSGVRRQERHSFCRRVARVMFRGVASAGGVRWCGLACAVGFRVPGSWRRRARGGVFRCVVHRGARGFP